MFWCLQSGPVCSVMVVRQTEIKQKAHTEVREAFILLHSRGYKEEAQRLYNRLLRDMPDYTNKELLDDFQRTLILVDPSTQRPPGHPDRSRRLW